MKENLTVAKKNRQGGYELLSLGTVSVSLMREYWKGSPWRALREMKRSF